jgi:hypothetical protein
MKFLVKVAVDPERLLDPLSGLSVEAKDPLQRSARFARKFIKQCERFTVQPSPQPSPEGEGARFRFFQKAVLSFKFRISPRPSRVSRGWLHLGIVSLRPLSFVTKLVSSLTEIPYLVLYSS